MASARAHPGFVQYSSLALQDDVLAGLPLGCLYACRSTGRLFAAWEGRVEQRAPTLTGDVARAFYCPVCGARLALGVAAVASCASCGWVAAQAGLTAVSDLLARDGEPWPRVAARVGELALQIAGGKLFADERKLEKARVADEDVETETDIPPDALVLDGGVRRCAQMPPRRRLPRGTAVPVSPYTDAALEGVAWERPNAAALLPAVVEVAVRRVADSDELDVDLQLHNATGSDVTFCARGGEGGEKGCLILAGARAAVAMRVAASEVEHGQSTLSTSVATVVCHVRAADKSDQQWEYAMHIWHWLRYM